MNIKAVMKKCKDEGYPITAQGLYIAGKKCGFLTEIPGDTHLAFNKQAFLKWLDEAKQGPPEGWVTVKELSEKLGLQMNKAYNLVNDTESHAIRVGSGRGVLYVDPKRIKELIRKRAEHHRKFWGEEQDD